MNIIGEGFNNEILNQVKQRQKIYGSANRSNQVLSYLNSKTGWCKLVSGAIVNKEPRPGLGLPSAQNYVLFNGTVDEGKSLGAGGRSDISRTNSIYTNTAYGLGGLEFGNRPMPGLTSANIKTETRGSLKTATVQIKAWNRTQFDIIDVLYLRLGYSVLLEWGHSSYYDNQGTFIGLTGEDNFNYVPPTGNELITQYIAVNSSEVINYWNPGYALTNYVQQILGEGYPYPIDNVSKEIFKRLYHNMAYLVKKKGTISGLRQLINIWGIPDTILRINEFGGKDQNNLTYDQWYNRYSYAYTPSVDSSVNFPWLPLNKNYISESKYIVPDSIEFRFKTDGIPSSSYYSQSLLVKKYL
jgi:hypothetical protein